MGAVDKIKFFHYFITRIILGMRGDLSLDLNNVSISDFSSWANGSGLSKLKLLKLLFFAVVIDAHKTKGSKLLDTVFNNFYAMPYGPVESDVYNHLCELNNYTFTNQSMSFSGDIDVFYYDDLCPNLLMQIDQSIRLMIEENNNILDMSAFDLVELSHKAVSWQIVFSEAKRKRIYSLCIPNEIIKSTTTYFQ
ncbi:MAG: type II toxin-antitoxin system antitoxin SocA domain-containing protein [Tannerellaceae bacterium]